MLTLVIIGGNLIGCFLTFLYFSFINVAGDTLPQRSPSILHIIFVIIAVGIIFLITSVVSHRWSRPLDQALKGEIPMNGTDEISAEQLKRKALHFVPMMAGTTLLGWIMAGFIFVYSFSVGIGLNWFLRTLEVAL